MQNLIELLELTFIELLCVYIADKKLTYENHELNNTFLSPDAEVMKMVIKNSEYNMIGIAKNPPASEKCDSKRFGFVYLDKDFELRWCYLPCDMYEHWLLQLLPKGDAKKFMDEVYGYNRHKQFFNGGQNEESNIRI